MKTYKFQNKYTPEEIIQQLKRCTKNRVEAVLEGGIGFSHFGNTICLIKKKSIQHPFQRVFVGRLQETREGTILSGQFCYPILSVLIFVAFEAIILYGYINMLFSTLTTGGKCISSLFFLVILLVPVLIFITGRTAFQKEEEDVLKLLQQNFR